MHVKTFMYHESCIVHHFIMYNIFFLFLIAIATAAFIALPLFKKKKGKQGSVPPLSDTDTKELKELLSQKEAAYAALKELEFDYGVGKLSDEDYKELQQKYQGEAIAVLKRIDELQGKSGVGNIEKLIEQEITRARARRTSISALDSDEDIEREIKEARRLKVEGKQGLICPGCGKTYQPDDRFCSGCGRKLT